MNDLFKDLLRLAAPGEVRVRVIRCTCKPGDYPCTCEQEVRSTIMATVEDAEVMADIEEYRLMNPGRAT